MTNILASVRQNQCNSATVLATVRELLANSQASLVLFFHSLIFAVCVWIMILNNLLGLCSWSIQPSWIELLIIYLHRIVCIFEIMRCYQLWHQIDVLFPNYLKCLEYITFLTQGTGMLAVSKVLKVDTARLLVWSCIEWICAPLWVVPW